MPESVHAPETLLSSIDLEAPLDAVILLKRTGTTLAAWTRTAMPLDVITVMAATLLASLETIVEALGGPSPQSALVDVGSRRMLATKVDSHVALFLVAPRSVSDSFLREEARRMVQRIAAAKPGGPKKLRSVPKSVAVR